MTVQTYIAQLEKSRGIAEQDISIFDSTPVREVFKTRKQAALYLETCHDEEQRESVFQIIEDCETTIKKYFYL